jgi:hypothetical protein
MRACVWALGVGSAVAIGLIPDVAVELAVNLKLDGTALKL